MLLENLKLMVNAGADALMTTCGLAVDEVSISQIRQGQITFPAMGQIKFHGGTLQSVRLGGDTMLCGHLAEQVDADKGQSGFAKLAQAYLNQALEEMEGRYPRGEVVDLEVGPRTVFTRGIRTFGIKLRTRIGQLFVLAEVPSKLEYEQAKRSEFQSSMISTYLPKDWQTREKISVQGQVDSFLVYLRKVESDLHVEICLEDGGTETRTGLVLEQGNLDNQRVLHVNLNLEHGPASLLKAGDRVTAYVGVTEKSVEMDLEYLGAKEHTVKGTASVPTAIFSLPDELRMVQRRRAFRIGLLQAVPVEVVALADNAENPIWMSEPESSKGATGRLVDLSFSGARIIGDNSDFCGMFPEGSMIRCRVYFPEIPKPFSVTGMVRRSNAKLVDRETYQAEMGIEFQVTAVEDREALEIIRQIVLKEQRSVLARRVQTTGV